jgi:hypothetical protein
MPAMTSLHRRLPAGRSRTWLALPLALVMAAAALPPAVRAGEPPGGASAGATTDAIGAGTRPPVPVSSPAAPARRYALTMREPVDFVSQYTDVACVGASVQMMLNMMRRGADRQPVTQARLLRSAQTVSNRIYVRRFGGASALGWAYALERAGGGPYRVRAYATRNAALRAVVEAMRATGRPAGLLVWQGAHAWVVGGFRTSADPATGSYRVTGLVIDDPWWPRVSGSRGRTRQPGSVLTPAEVAPHFVRFQRGPRRSGSVMNGSYVVVLPIEPAVIRERARGVL